MSVSQFSCLTLTLTDTGTLTLTGTITLTLTINCALLKTMDYELCTIH